MRAGVTASIAAKKRRQQLAKHDKSNKYILGDEESQIDSQEQIRVGEFIGSKKFQVAQVPVGVWSVGFIMIVAGIYFISVLIAHDKQASIKGFDQGFWWQYLICGSVVLLGISFILVKKIEKIVIDKEKGQILIRSRSIICQKVEHLKPIQTFSDIFIIKRGHESTMNKTIHYVISIHFSDEKSNIEILECNSFKKTKNRFIAIRKFLGMSTDALHVGVIDESTKN